MHPEPASELLEISHKSKKWQWRNNLLTWRQHHIFWRCFVSLVTFSYSSKFHVNIITGSGVWQFSLIGDWPGIRKLEITPSEFCPIPGDWSELGIPNLARSSLIKYYWMLPNARVKVKFYFYWVIKGNPIGGVKLPPTQIRFKTLTLRLLWVVSIQKSCLLYSFLRLGKFGYNTCSTLR